MRVTTPVVGEILNTPKPSEIPSGGGNSGLMTVNTTLPALGPLSASLALTCATMCPAMAVQFSVTGDTSVNTGEWLFTSVREHGSAS